MALMIIKISPVNTSVASPELSLAKIKTNAPESPNVNPATFITPILSFKSQAAIKTIRIGVMSNSNAA